MSDLEAFRDAIIAYCDSLDTIGINSIFTRPKVIRSKTYPDHVFFDFTVAKDDVDSEGNLLNGCLATLLDALMCICSFDNSSDKQGGITVDLNVTYLGKVKLGEKFIIETEVVKRGRRLSFLKATAFKMDGAQEIIADATQTLAMVASKM